MIQQQLIDMAALQARCNWPVEYHDSLSSTQDRAHRLADATPAAGCSLPQVIIAEQQSAGRGRGTNLWWTGAGSLAVSILFDPDYFGLGKQPLPQSALAAGVAVIDAVSQYSHPHHPGLHWPNDVFVAGRKLSGILIDVRPDGRHVLGIGLNVNNSMATAPEEVRTRAISLIELAGQPVDRVDVLVGLTQQLDVAFRRLAADAELFGMQFDPLCLQAGNELLVETAGRRVSGRCAGIATDGALLLDTFSGRQRIYSGVLR
jgi:BirA family biotin operon repressor/biotin-[acetyl-CoA-carboxylase] ligase